MNMFALCEEIILQYKINNVIGTTQIMHFNNTLK